MKLFSFPLASLEKAIHKRVLTLPSPHREWFTERWAQKPYKKAFVENKAMPLVTLVAKGKTLDEAAALKNSVIAEELALPPVKIHCSILAEDAIKAAVLDYKTKHAAAVAA